MRRGAHRYSFRNGWNSKNVLRVGAGCALCGTLSVWPSDSCETMKMMISICLRAQTMGSSRDPRENEKYDQVAKFMFQVEQLWSRCVTIGLFRLKEISSLVSEAFVQNCPTKQN